MGKDKPRYFCPDCGSEILQEDTICPECNYDLTEWQSLDYGHKLIMALTHRDTATRMLAVYLLGEKRILQSFSYLKEAYQQSIDPYFKAEILQAMFKIDSRNTRRFIQKNYDENISIILKKTMQDILTGDSNGSNQT